MSPVLDTYDNSPHTSTKIAPNNASIENEIQVFMNNSKRVKEGNRSSFRYW
jgi:hypothetical protein